MTGSSGGELTAWEIMQKMDGGHGDEVVAILSGSSTDPVVEERGTFEVVLPASSMNLPDGGWVELEIAGDAYFKGTAFAGSDGNVRFTVPRQRIGAVITVTLTAFTPDGNPYSSGSKNSLVEEGGTTAFTIPLTDLNTPTVTYTDGMLTNETEGGYKLVRYSWLNDKTPKFSVTNPYDDGSATMTVELDGTTLTGDADSGNISNQPLSDGQHTINITLSKPGLSSDIRIEKKILVKMKAVNATVSSMDAYYEDHRDGNSPCVKQDMYIASVNDGVKSTKTCYSSGGTVGAKLRTVIMDSKKNTVTLTAPGSIFKFWTTVPHDDWTGESMGWVVEDRDQTTKTLTELKANNYIDSGEVISDGNSRNDEYRYSWYHFYVTLTDVVYTAGSD